MKKIKACWQLCKRKLKRLQKQNPVLHFLVIVICALTFCLAVTLLTCEGGLVAVLIGTESKKETVLFIFFGMGGILAAINAVAINRRADAQG